MAGLAARPRLAGATTDLFDLSDSFDFGDGGAEPETEPGPGSGPASLKQDVQLNLLASGSQIEGGNLRGCPIPIVQRSASLKSVYDAGAQSPIGRLFAAAPKMQRARPSSMWDMASAVKDTGLLRRYTSPTSRPWNLLEPRYLGEGADSDGAHRPGPGVWEEAEAPVTSRWTRGEKKGPVIWIGTQAATVNRGGIRTCRRPPRYLDSHQATQNCANY